MPYIPLYGLTGITNVMPLPIRSTIAPTANDFNAVEGQEWINTTTGDVYVYGGSVGGIAAWKAVGANAGGLFTSITVSGPAGSSLNGNFLVNSGTASSTTISAGASTGNVGIINGTGTGAVIIGNANAGNISLSSGATISTAGTTSINASQNFNTNINTGTSTGTVAIGSANAGNITISSGGIVSVGAASTTVRVGTVAGTTNTELYAFKATADAGTSADAAFTANSGLVACVISNLDTAPAAPGTITVTNSTIIVGSSVFVNFALAGAEDATMTIKKIRITNNTATITYTNDGAAAIASDCYMSLMVIS